MESFEHTPSPEIDNDAKWAKYAERIAKKSDAFLGRTVRLAGSEEGKVPYASIEAIKNQTPEQREASLQDGLDLMLSEFKRDPGYFARMAQLRAQNPDRIAEQQHSDDVRTNARSLGANRIDY